ncbi:MAG: carboxypeptidase-like regulatory domain-containing protein, partial [Candidatus Sulfotelmatobacter sp.]
MRSPLETQMNAGDIPQEHRFLLTVNSMKINSKTKTIRRSSATRTLLTTRLVLSALFVLAGTLNLAAQNVVLSGAISGRVADQRGAVVPGAPVILRNLATGLQQSGVTNRAGLYQFLALMPGTYSVTVTGKGFHDVEALVRVQVGNTTLQDLTLAVGGSGETVKVTSTMPLLRPAESSASTVLDQSFIDELPLNGRRYTDFTTLTPNTSYDGDTGLVSIAGQQGGEDSGYANGNG